MGTGALATYLADHLAGSEAACRLLGRLADAFDAEARGETFRVLLTEILADQQVLQALIAEVGASDSRVRAAAAQAVETLTRPKFPVSPDAEDRLGVFEALEVLSLGVLGKRALWRALATIAPGDPRLELLDFAVLIARAEQQFERLERERLAEAGRTLGIPPDA